MTSNPPPTHIVPDGDSLRTLCGRHIFRDPRALPFVAAAFVDRNVRAHGLPVCDLCDAVADADEADRS